ncbi:Small-conductance mechanosensitive ion channel [Pseudooceanicola batsensis HTCC2597]|uniref:Small-conductance mechanosensitive ion channel n=1 Tax=Pseudooceanicola batsensis (strain ATCC BAA-863 / DSM 15984 / KCTC 12145 / HTCC2597) TaxID=252305 RepID=A3TYI4_PSEBH|nr:mechanosensitive ion channel domain-containing protein [Pseudooceanicola batsensis]EAQ03218.1 Small-conductance mechanosensitive ion channel [Pseudooceanicola batsensis HTCC2597]
MKTFLTTLLLILLLPFQAIAQDAAEEVPPEPTSLKLLLDVIEDEAAREQLIEQLRAAGAETEATPGEVVETLADGAPPPEDLSFGRRIAMVTQEAAEGIADSATAAWSQVTRAPAVFEGLRGDEVPVLLDALWELAFVIAATVVVFVMLRRIGKSIYARMGRSARDGGFARTVALYIASGLIDALNVILAWAAGYVIALLALGEFGQIGIRQTLYLNAFLLVEMAKLAVRLVLSPSATHLRPMPIGDRAASYLSARLSLLVGIGGYGQLLVVPIINANVSFAAGRAISTLIAFAVLAIAVWLILRNRRPVTEWMLGERGGRPAVPTDERPAVAETRDEPMTAVAAEAMTPDTDAGGMGSALADAESPSRHRGTLHFLATHWHWPALAYLFVMFMIVLVRPGDAVFRAFAASGQVAVIGLIGVAISGLISRAMARGVSLPDRITTRMPLLETRLNRFVPRLLFVLRLVIFLLVVLFAMNAIDLIDLRGWMASQIGVRLTGAVFSVFAILIVAFLVWLALTSWVDYRLNPEFGPVASARESTLLSLLRNAATIALIIVTLMFVLAEIGLDIAPLLASAGVLGLAIGFGAQKMVQDIITGIFIQFENAMNVGDVVTVGGTTGTVERLTIRSVSLRDLAGAFHIVPFSSVDMVTNYMRDFGYFVCDMGVAYRENVDEVKKAMFDAFDELRSNPENRANIIGDLEWFGLNSFGDSAVVCRARIKSVPGAQWGVGRAYNEVLKRVFDDRNIEIPFPHQTIYLGEAKDGSTQTFKVDMDQDATA